MFSLDELVRAADRLEPVPANVIRLAGLVADPENRARDIIDVVAYDQALSATLLRYANSAASSPVTPVVTVRDAVIRLGRSQVLSAALGPSVHRWMQDPVPAYHLAAGELWRSAMLATVGAENIVRRGTVDVPPETLSSALLADVGKVVLSRCLDPETLELLRRAESEGHQSLHRAELEVLGIHHGEVGAIVAEHSQLPEGIVTGIRYHHAPEEDDGLIAYATCLSCTVAEIIMADPPGREAPGWPDWIGRVGIAPGDLAWLAAATAARYEELVASYE